jgi:uncharacterized membrane protein
MALLAYGLLNAYVILRSFLGFGYQMAVTPLLTMLAFAFALLHGSESWGTRRTLLLLGLTFTVSLAFESFGVATGLVYGDYHYTSWLGPKFLGLVPYLIAAAWFMMVYPSYRIAASLTPSTSRLWLWRLELASLGALIMTAWDLVMDPVMVAGEHWVWEVEGAYFGIPLQNFWGWWLTAFVTFMLFTWLSRAEPSPQREIDLSFERLAVHSYALTGACTVITAIQLGLKGPSIVGIFAMLPWALLGWWGVNGILKRSS